MEAVEARELLYEGKAKKLFATRDPDFLLRYF
jgi:phosphoribosylaminoimidazole-succinocarboxamide synthase